MFQIMFFPLYMISIVKKQNSKNIIYGFLVSCKILILQARYIIRVLICHSFILFSRKPSTEGHPSVSGGDVYVEPDVEPQYGWMVEECILAAYDKKNVKCPNHGNISLAHIAPDTVSNCYSFIFIIIISIGCIRLSKTT